MRESLSTSIAGGVAAVLIARARSAPRRRNRRARFTERSTGRTESRWRRSSSSSATTSRDSRPRPRRPRTGPSHFFNVPFNPYELHVEVQGFKSRSSERRRPHVDPARGRDHARAARPSPSRVERRPRRAARPPQLETDVTDLPHRHRQVLHRSAPRRRPLRAMEEIVTSTPGFALDENGRYHFQGAHSQSEYVIDGQTISDQTGVTFSNSIDPGIAQSIEVIYGNVRRSTAKRSAAVINMTTKSGLGTPGSRATSSAATRRFDTYQAGRLGRDGGTRQLRRSSPPSTAAGSDYFTDPLNPDNLNNHRQHAAGLPPTRHGVARLSRNAFRLSALLGRTDRDVTEHVHSGGHRPGQDGQDRRPELQPGLAERPVRLARSLDVTAFARLARFTLYPSAGDTPGHRRLEPVARQLRHHAVLHLDDRHPRDQGRRRLQAVPDRGALPVRHHRPGVQRPRIAGLQPEHRALRPDAGRQPVRLSPTRRTGTYCAGVRAGHHPLEEPDGQRRRAVREQQPAGDRCPSSSRGSASRTTSRRRARSCAATYSRILYTPEYENILLSSSARRRRSCRRRSRTRAPLGGGVLPGPVRAPERVHRRPPAGARLEAPPRLRLLVAARRRTPATRTSS